jgi:hypothetical protein
MIEVIKEGTKKKVICPFCEAVLRYTIDDVKEDLYDIPTLEAYSVITKKQYIRCPLCDEKINLLIE